MRVGALRPLPHSVAIYTIGRKRPTTSCKRPVIWPNEQTSTASSNVGKQFSPRSTTAASLSSARLAFSAFFFLNFENRRFYCPFDRFHPGRSAQHVHGVLENSRLLEQDRLPVRGKPNPFFAWCGERLVGAIGMTRIRGVHVSQH